MDSQRRLAELQPSDFLSDMGTSLTNMVLHLYSLGREEEAFAESQEAVSIYRPGGNKARGLRV